MRFFYSKSSSLANVLFSVFCPQWRLADLVRIASQYGSFCSLRKYIVKPALKDGSVVTFFLQMPVTSCDSPDEVRDTLMNDYGYFHYRIDSIINPQYLQVDEDDVVDNDDLPF